MKHYTTYNLLILIFGIFLLYTHSSGFAQEKQDQVWSKERKTRVLQYYRLSKTDSLTVQERLYNVTLFLKEASYYKQDSMVFIGLMRKTRLLGQIKQYDSAIAYTHQLYDLAKKNRDTLYIQKAYRKFALYNKWNDQNSKAFLFFVKALKWARFNKDTLGIGKNLLQMANIQTSLGDYSGSKITAIDGVRSIEKTNDLRILSGLYHIISVVNRHQENYSEALKYNSKALSLGKDSISKQKISVKNIFIFKNTQALIYANQKKYKKAIAILKELLGNAKLKQDQREYARVLGNLGYVKWLENKKNEESITFIYNSLTIQKEVNDIKGIIHNNIYLTRYYFTKNKKLALIHANEAYTYSKKYRSLTLILQSLGLIIDLKENIHKEAREYKESHLKLDSINQRNRDIYATSRYENEQLTYKNKVLQKEKDKGIQWIRAIALLLVLSLLGIGYYYYRQQLYKKRFLQLLDHKPVPIPAAKEKTITINKDIADQLLVQLENFEQQLGFLDPATNAKDLAKSFGSNTSYLSMVVNTYKQKSISQYINDLRIAYAIEKLQSDPTFRKYTVKAISKEAGFKSAESFSKKFYKKTGIYPSYFIKKLEADV
ncbi:helix-turn-helix domain-containing protein [Aquimarina sp. 2201CG1-2-11]|uniref:helix-turn-helix domain-containing protein n=1 Tax=Aquimarina discodermiae TaxID=3231043 RepID=UPI003461CED0